MVIVALIVIIVLVVDIIVTRAERRRQKIEEIQQKIKAGLHDTKPYNSFDSKDMD